MIGLIILLSVCFFLRAQNSFQVYSVSTGLGYRAIFTDNAGNVLFYSPQVDALIKFDGVIFDTINIISNSNVNSVRQGVADANNKYWLATNVGLILYDGLNWTTYTTLNGLISDNVYSVYCSNGKVFAGTSEGYSIFDNGLFTNYNTANGLGNNKVNCFVNDNNQNLWIGTDSGLTKMSNNGSFINYTRSNSAGLKSDTVLSLYFDGINLWFGTNSNCLHRFELSTNVIKNVSEIFDTPILFSKSPPIRSLTTGPHGGIVFGMIRERFYEIYQNKIYVYYNQNNLVFNVINGNFSFAYDNVNNKLWISGMNLLFNSFTLDSFGEYNGYALSNTFENYKALDINEVSAAITNRGDMFWDVDIQLPNFKVPKTENKSAIFVNSLWFGGLDQGRNLHLAAQTYRQTGIDYWPGPLDTINGATDTINVIKYDKIWKINWFDIEQFKYFYNIGAVQNGSWSPSNDIITWPARGEGNNTRNMAPFVDVNNNGIYDPFNDGDYPYIKGDQMLYWIYNDNLGPHTESGGLPMKLEIHASAYAYYCPELMDADSSINYTTFYNYKLYNRSGIDYDSCFIGNFNDFDLGLYFDDVNACNPKSNLAFCYNVDEEDEGFIGYGINPPVIGNVILNGPKANPDDLIDNDNDGIIDEPDEKHLMNSCIFYENSTSAINGNPTSSDKFFNYLKGLWKDGSNITYGGNGIGGTISTKFMFSDSTWYPMTVADIRSLQSTGPFSFPANSSIDYDFAIVYARDTVGNDSPQLFQQLFDNAARAKTWFDDNTFPSCVGPNKVKEITKPKNELELFPNPTSDVINFRSQPGHPVKEVRIFNALGKEVYFNSIVNTNEIFVGNKAPGIYLLSLKYVDGTISTNKFIKQ